MNLVTLGGPPLFHWLLFPPPHRTHFCPSISSFSHWYLPLVFLCRQNTAPGLERFPILKPADLASKIPRLVGWMMQGGYFCQSCYLEGPSRSGTGRETSWLAWRKGLLDAEVAGRRWGTWRSRPHMAAFQSEEQSLSLSPVSHFIKLPRIFLLQSEQLTVRESPKAPMTLMSAGFSL